MSKYKFDVGTTATTEIKLLTVTGLVQYAPSIEAMLADYNRDGRVYEVRTTTDGRQVLWHKGHQYAAGTFVVSDRAQ